MKTFRFECPIGEGTSAHDLPAMLEKIAENIRKNGEHSTSQVLSQYLDADESSAYCVPNSGGNMVGVYGIYDDQRTEKANLIKG
jgi:hypothetical protein